MNAVPLTIGRSATGPSVNATISGVRATTIAFNVQVKMFLPAGH